MRPYHGLLTAVVTPFRADGAVDEEAAVRSAATCSTTAPTAW